MLVTLWVHLTFIISLVMSTGFMGCLGGGGAASAAAG